MTSVHEGRSKFFSLLLRCESCGNIIVHELDEVPQGLQAYQIRVIGESGTSPLSNEKLIGFEESFNVLASCRQDAYERSLIARTVKPAGHLVRTFIDTTEHFDERH